MATTERPTQLPCQWCGKAVPQARTGRLKHYCDRSCRQRAYEVRTAEARLQRDLGAGRVRAEPAERVVERVEHRAWPTDVETWARGIGVLTGQVRDGTIKAHQHQRILWRLRDLAAALNAAIADTSRASRPGPAGAAAPTTAPPTRPPSDPIALRLAAKWRDAATLGVLPFTTLTRIAVDAGADVAGVRRALAVLVDAGVVHLARGGPAAAGPVDPTAIPEHARFQVTVTG